MKVSYLALCATACFAAGCGSSGGGAYKPSETKTVSVTKVGEGDGPTLFPIAVGNQWTYDSVSVANVQGRPQTIKQAVTMEIKKIDETPQGKMVSFEIREDDVVKSSQVWMVNDAGVFQVSITSATNPKTATFTPPQCVLPFPITDGKEVPYEGVGPSALSITTNFKGKTVNEGAQIADTAAAQFSAYRIVSTYDLKAEAMNGTKKVPLAGALQSIAWFSPKVGMVRLQQRVVGQAGEETVTLTLAQSTVK